MSYEQDIKINNNDIIGEILKQADIYYKYALEVEELKRGKDFIEEKLNIQKTKSIDNIRTNFEKYGLNKEPSDSAISNGKLWYKDEDFLTAEKELFNAEYKLGVAQAAEQSVAMKKSCLEMIVKLMGMNFYAEPQNTDKQNVKKEAKTNTNVVNEALIQEKKDEI